MSKATPISIAGALAKTTHYKNRVPETTDATLGDAFAMVSEYRDGEIYVGQYDGYSEWERHPKGDEIVQVLAGETDLILLTAEGEVYNRLAEGEFLVVPQNVWHRFESPKGVKVLAVTPQPTDHQIEKPEEI